MAETRSNASRLSAVLGRAAGLRDYLSNGSVEVALSAMGFVSSVLIARLLGPAGRGQLTAALLWPTGLCILIGLGLQQSFAYAVGVGWASTTRVVRLGVNYTLLVGVPAMAAYWVLCPAIFSKQFGDDLWVARAFAPYIPLSMFVGFLHSVYQGCGDFKRWNIARVFRNGAWTASILVLPVAGALTVFNLLVVQVVICVVLAAYLLSRLGRLTSLTEGAQAGATRMIFKYGFAVYLSTIAYNVNQQLDQMLLSLWVDPAELGQYVAAASISGLLLLASSAIGPIVFAKAARASSSLGEQRRHVRMALLLNTALLVPAGIVLAIAAPWVTRIIYGPMFDVAGQVLRVLAPAAVFLGLGFTLTHVLRGVGLPMYSAYGTLVGAAVTIVGLACLLPRSGIWGAAWVSLVAYGSMMIVQAFYLWRWAARSRPAARSTAEASAVTV